MLVILLALLIGTTKVMDHYYDLDTKEIEESRA